MVATVCQSLGHIATLSALAELDPRSSFGARGSLIKWHKICVVLNTWSYKT